MELTIYAKKRTSKEGNKFYTYFTALTKKNGEQLTTEVKFREECGAPSGDKCPMNIVVDKNDCNYSERTVEYKTKEGEDGTTTRRRLWVSKWSEGAPYIDTSMDEFE